MKIILDTNFIIEIVKNKVDILDIENYGTIVIPEQVLNELKNLREEGNEIAGLALKIIERNKAKFESIRLENRYVDLGIINFVSENKGYAVASLDKELKKKLAGKARIMTLKARKKIVLL